MTLKHILGDLPVIRILDFLLDNQAYDHTKSGIAEGAGIGPTVMKRDFPNLVECGIVFETRRISGVGLYALDVTNEMTQSLIEFDEKLTDYCTDKILDEQEEEMSEMDEVHERFMAGPPE